MSACEHCFSHFLRCHALLVMPFLVSSRLNGYFMLERLITEAQVDGLRAIINDNDDFVVVAHKNPDGDAVGSSLALALFLRSLGKSATVVLPNGFPSFLGWLPGAQDIVVYETAQARAASLIASAGAIFCLDFNSVPRLGDMAAAVDASPAPKVLVDHHLFPDEGFAVAISLPVACSTSELVFRVIYRLASCDVLSLEMAQAIYTGMMTDTGSFAYASNRKDIYIIVAELISKGVDKDLIYRKVFYNYSVSRLKLIGFVLYEKLKVFEHLNASLITLSHAELKKFNVAKGDTEGLVNMPLQKKGLRFSCFLREELPGKINVSLRSVGDFPCNAVAADFFNGGGHKNASGGEVRGSMEDAVALFEKALKAYEKQLTDV